MESIIVSSEVLNTFDIDAIDLIALLWQTGYLTFDKKIQNFDDSWDYQLKVPNKEIQKSLNQLFIKYLTNQSIDILYNQKQIYNDITENLDQLKITLVSLFASIPYNNYANNIIARYEGYYSSVVFTYLMSLGFPCIPEDVSNKGRIDLTIKLPNRIIILEFKVDKRETALEQIKKKKYHEKYLLEAKEKNKELFIVGICFDSEEKNISEFDWQGITT